MEVTLAIDYGTARVGTAVSAGWMARPLEVLPHGTMETLIERLKVLAKQEMVTRFLVGLPINADGSEGEQADAVRAFAARLAAAVPQPVFLWNEYGSSQAAQTHMIASGTGRKARRERLDAIAAAVFLQEFIEQAGVGAERVDPRDGSSDA
ncbi:MAG: Holliday junction resolvase RuvX [Chloroflexota bacterium]|nr:Holliday junction resolvase RuvX [Chloroflexota bacterium]